MDFQKLAKMDFDSTSMKAFDWGLSLISVGYGLYAGSALWFGAGMIGCAAAWYRPMSRFQRFLQGFVKRR